MRTDTRDRRATAAVKCPVCHAPAGDQCHALPGQHYTTGRYFIHSQRRAAWLEHKHREEARAKGE